MNTVKKFNMIDIVILTLMVGSEAVTKGVADLTLPIPAIGQIGFGLADVYTFLIWGIVIIWFVFKLGLFGTAGLVVTVGGVLSMLAIPVGLAAGVAIAVYLTNNPKVKSVVGLVTAPENPIGEMEALEETKEAAEVATNVEQVGEGAEGVGAAEGNLAGGAEGTVGAIQENRAGQVGGERTGGGTQQGSDTETKPEFAPGTFGEETPISEGLKEDLVGSNPLSEKTENSGSFNNEPDQETTDRKTDLQKAQEAKADKAERLRKAIEKLPQGEQQPTAKDQQDENDDNLAATAGYR